MRAIISIIKNEFLLICRNPIVIIFCAIIVLFAIHNALACYVLLPKMQFIDHNEAFYIGIGNFFWIISLLFAFLSMCLAITSIASERSSNSIRVLLTKPIYRKDIIISKFVSISIFEFLLIILTVVLLVSLMMAVYGGPTSAIELILRMASFSILLFLNCSFTLGLIFLLSILLKRSEAMMISIIFITVEWLGQIQVLPYLPNGLDIIDPMTLYIHAFAVTPGIDLFRPSLSFNTWLNNAVPFVLLMLLEVVIIVLVNCIAFNREEA